jgi:hypothetical protein
VSDADDSDDDRRIVGRHVMRSALLGNELDRTVDGHAERVREEEVALLNEDAGEGRKFA